MTFPLDKQIRNATSNIYFYYDDKIHLYLGKNTNGDSFVTLPETVKNVYLPIAINNVKGFLAAVLLHNLKSDEGLYKRALKMLDQEKIMQDKNIVEVNYHQTGKSTNTYELGMLEIQARVYQYQYLLVKVSTVLGNY